MLLALENLQKRIGPRELFGDVNLQVRAGDRLGIVGPNGAGKTTLLRLACGEEAGDGGRVLRPRGVRLGWLRQEVDPSVERSVREETLTALDALRALEDELRKLEGEMEAAGQRGEAIDAELADRYDRTQAAFAHGGGFEGEARVERVLEGLGFDAEARERPLSSFSGGWLMRVELAKLLLAEPDVLLLDEPTNHLDLPAIRWFEQALDGFRGGVVVVSHDRTFLRRHVGRIAELDGRGGFELYECGYDAYLARRAERAEQLEAQRRNQDQKIAHMEKFVERFRAKASKAPPGAEPDQGPREARAGREPRPGATRHATPHPEAGPGRPGRDGPRGHPQGLRRQPGVRGHRPRGEARGADRTRRPERRRQVDAPAHPGRRPALRPGRAHAGPQRPGGLLRPAPARGTGSQPQRARGARRRRALRRSLAPARPPGGLPLLRGRRRQEGGRPLRRREVAPRPREAPAATEQRAGAGRAHQSPGHPRLRGAGGGPAPVRGHPDLHLPRPAASSTPSPTA